MPGAIMGLLPYAFAIGSAFIQNQQQQRATATNLRNQQRSIDLATAYLQTLGGPPARVTPQAIAPNYDSILYGSQAPYRAPQAAPTSNNAAASQNYMSLLGQISAAYGQDAKKKTGLFGL